MFCTRLTILAAALSVTAAALAGMAPQTASSRHITAAELIPLTRSQKEFRIINGKDQGRLVPVTFEADPGDEKSWKLGFGDYGRISLRSSSGDLIMDRLDLFKSKSYIVYEPPVRVLPAEIESPDPIVRQSRYKMYSAETGKLKRAGRVAHLVKRVSPSQFNTPAGLIEGYYIEIEHKMDMELQSQLLLTVGLGCRPDEGLVYGTAHYKLRKLGGLLTEMKTSAAALAAQPIRLGY